MGTRYATVTLSAFNANPPPDDGSVSASNLVTWAGIKTKLADPIKTQAAAIDTALVAALNTSCRAISSNDSVVAGDHWKTLEVTGTTTITLMAASSAGAGFIVDVFNNGSGLVTVDRTSAADTINNVSAVATIAPLESWRFKTNTTLTGYNVVSKSSEVPAGTILDFGGTSAPNGYLACDGSAVSRTTYARLFGAIGTTWGVGNGSTTFNVPSLARKVAVGSGGSGTATLANSVGSTGGEETHTLVTAEMPQHRHGVLAFSGTGDGTEPTSGFVAKLTSGGQNIWSAGADETNNVMVNQVGSGTAHNTMQPSAVVLKIIKI